MWIIWIIIAVFIVIIPGTVWIIMTPQKPRGRKFLGTPTFYFNGKEYLAIDDENRYLEPGCTNIVDITP